MKSKLIVQKYLCWLLFRVFLLAVEGQQLWKDIFSMKKFLIKICLAFFLPFILDQNLQQSWINIHYTDRKEGEGGEIKDSKLRMSTIQITQPSYLNWAEYDLFTLVLSLGHPIVSLFGKREVGFLSEWLG